MEILDQCESQTDGEPDLKPMLGTLDRRQEERDCHPLEQLLTQRSAECEKSDFGGP